MCDKLTCSIRKAAAAAARTFQLYMFDLFLQCCQSVASQLVNLQPLRRKRTSTDTAWQQQHQLQVVLLVSFM